ncbi:MAG: transposase [Herbaspirillum sp.]|uniref:transposase n=1 Tax=Herbaspirillum sp. TaxID=1890675 RepID=UPI002590CEA5|nr:transposase [Herbaspirillum sp.]MCP4555239.1 transposase [Herbaspirillum sp.]
MTIVKQYFRPLLVWFSAQVYAELIARATEHLLVKLHGKLDFAGLEQACAAYHHTTGPGTKPTHPVPRLVRALLVQYVCDWSLRQLEFQIRYNLVVKWFVGYNILDAGPDHSTLQRFEDWVCAQQQRVFFDQVLQQIDAEFPADRTQTQLGDTYALHAAAAKEALVRLLRHTCERVLRELAVIAPSAHQRVSAKLERSVLFGPTDERSYFRMSSPERAAQLQNTVVGALQLIQLVRAQLLAQTAHAAHEQYPLVNWLACLEKILGDEVAMQRDAAGRVVRVTRLPKEQRGSYRLGSATDPEATYRVHGADKVDFGYNVSVAATINFVREIQADTGAQPDAVALPDLLTAQIEYHDTVPTKFIYDAAAGNGKTHAAVERATTGRTQLVAPLIAHAKNAARFTPDDFTLSADGNTLTCPNAQTTTTA